MIHRRRLLALAAGAVPCMAAGGPVLARSGLGPGLRPALSQIERASGGRLGVALHEPSSGRRFAWRGDERFPMCSTFKAVLAAATLARVDRGLDQLDRRIPVTASDILGNSPMTATHVGGEAPTVAALCEAAVIWSDNGAANLLLVGVGGPAGLTRYLRGLGDGVTRLDRNEMALNSCIPGDPRDTTSPLSMAATLGLLLLSPALTAPSRALLTAWMIDNRTGDKRLRAGLPTSWRVGDKTGSGAHGTVNDVAILWPPGRPPLILTSYLTGSTLDEDGRNGVQAKVAVAVSAAV